jgi:hypothetical protein
MEQEEHGKIIPLCVATRHLLFFRIQSLIYLFSYNTSNNVEVASSTSLFEYVEIGRRDHLRNV